MMRLPKSLHLKSNIFYSLTLITIILILFQLSSYVISTTTSTSISQSKLTPQIKSQLNFNENSFYSNSTILSRPKRQNGIGGSTYMIGSRIVREASAGDFLMGNFAMNNAAPSRGKRSIANMFRKWFQSTFTSESESKPKPKPNSKSEKNFQQNQNHNHKNFQTSRRIGAKNRGSFFQTKTQEKFWLFVNQNANGAMKFVKLNEIQGNSILRDSLIVRSNGVKCNDVCDPQGSSVGFGLLGLCTGRYCRCDFENKGLNRREWACPIDKIFDPVKLICDYPANTPLCADPERTVNIPAAALG